jgi:hypothetical protein
VFEPTSLGDLLPKPAGVAGPQSSYNYNYGPNGNANNPAERAYQRKVEILSNALFPYVSSEPPTDMQVVMVAWGPSTPTQFAVPGYDTSNEGANVWVGTAWVRVNGNDQPSVSFSRSDSVPFTIYAPASTQSVLPMGKTGGSTGASYPPGSNPAVPGPVPTATALPGQQGTTTGFRASPYADLLFNLPAGTKPDKLTLRYTLRDVGQNDDVDLYAYNQNTGAWDKIASLEIDKPATLLSIPNPTQYTGAAGDVTLRLLSTAGQTNVDASFDLALNVDN